MNQNEDTAYAEIHHLRIMLSLEKDKVKKYQKLVEDIKQELDVLEIKLKLLNVNKSEY